MTVAMLSSLQRASLSTPVHPCLAKPVWGQVWNALCMGCALKPGWVQGIPPESPSRSAKEDQASDLIMSLCTLDVHVQEQLPSSAPGGEGQSHSLNTH